MQSLLDSDYAAYSRRNEELAYLANTLMAGCPIQARAFPAQEASDAAVAVCNLGLENWPAHWLSAEARGDVSVLTSQDFVTVFQVGWTVLHDEVSIYTAERLIDVLKDLRCDDDETQTALDELRVEMTKHWRAPWRGPPMFRHLDAQLVQCGLRLVIVTPQVFQDVDQSLCGVHADLVMQHGPPDLKHSDKVLAGENGDITAGLRGEASEPASSPDQGCKRRRLRRRPPAP